MMRAIYEISSSLKSQLKNIPSLPGIYMMKDKKGDIIYIGKAINLKDRVRSYFKVTSWNERPKLFFMMPKVNDIQTVITMSEKEALILEANLVNKYQPKYNVTLKDDKKFPWLMITYDEDYPRVVPIRDVVGFKKKYQKTKNKFFGPYTDSAAMWETYKILKEGFQLRLRRKPLFKDRPCMNYHLGLCSGPCQKLITYDDYHKIVRQVENFLLGKYDLVLKDLNIQMKEASEKLDFEKAAKIRDTIQKIEKVLERQIVVSDDHKLNQDIFASYFEGQNMVLELFLVREGKINAIESLTVDLPKDVKPEEAFNEGIKQYYTRILDENIPNEIIVQYDLFEKDYIEEWLRARSKEKVTIVCPRKGKKLELIRMAEQNAKLAIKKIELHAALEEDLLNELQQELDLKNLPRCIECFDISHLGGTSTVGSVVCFVNGKPEKSAYRKFKLKTVLNKINDFQAIKEIVQRRYTASKLPDLIIIDGGKGQLNSAKEALIDLNIDLTIVDLISIAKQREEIFKINKKDPILLDRNSKLLFLIQRIRDEAHRFAITFQRERRLKAAFQLELETIPGLNKARIKRLLKYFGSLKNIKDADLLKFASVLRQDLTNVKEIWERIKAL